MAYLELLEITTNPYLIKLLAQRGITTIEKYHRFDPPRLPKHPVLPNLPQALELIKAHVKKKHKITVVGDYDADGILATYLLYNLIRIHLQHNNLDLILPTRNEGYGLTPTLLSRVLKTDPKLVITIDNGITSLNEIRALRQRQIDVIVIDHHTPPPKAPSANIIIHPYMFENKWNPHETSATVLAFCLLKSLGLSTSMVEKYATFAGISIITDVMPVTGYNRLLVKKSLKNLNNLPTENFLFQITKTAQYKDYINTFWIGNILGPRLNAPGRLGDPLPALEALISQGSSNAEILEKLNRERQELTYRYLNIAPKYKIEVGNIDLYLIPHAPEGILGIIAGRLTQKHKRPSLVLSLGETTAKGSGRSPRDFNLIKFLKQYQHLFDRLGGHKQAAGFTIRRDSLEKFTRLLQQSPPDWNEFTSEKDTISELALTPVDINPTLYSALKHLEPFGPQNEYPDLKLQLKGSDIILKHDRNQKHVFVQLSESSRLIWWNMDQPLQQLNKLVFKGRIKQDTFRGKISYAFIVESTLS